MRHWTPEEALSYATGPITEPGRPFESYSSSNYLLLGLLIEKVTGTGYAGAVRILNDHSRPDPGQHAVRYLATCVGQCDRRRRGMTADAPTLATWGYRLYGRLVLPPDRTVELTTPVIGRAALGTMILGSDVYGPGAPLSGEDAVGHNGTMAGYTSLVVVLPADRLSIAIAIVGPDDLTSTAAQLAEDMLAASRT